MKIPNIVFLTFSCAFICSFSFCTNASKTSSVNSDTLNNTSSDTAYHLVWSDEFDSTAINTNNWNFETGGDGWGNHEQEYYQQQNATIENGNLVINAKKEKTGSNGYTSARMTTLGKKEFKYGKIEARIKMPVGLGLWPAFWMLGADIKTIDWPASGEIDIMEHINADSIIYGTLHWDSSGHVYRGGNTKSSPSDYHVYAIDWNKDSITWMIDNIPYHTASITPTTMEEFQRPYFILLNFAVGGDWPGQTIDDSKIPAKMFVDYVRVYQH